MVKRGIFDEAKNKLSQVSFFCVITIKLIVGWRKSLYASNTSPPRNRLVCSFGVFHLGAPLIFALAVKFDVLGDTV